MNRQDQSSRMIWGALLASNALYAAMPLLVQNIPGPVASVVSAALVASAAMSGGLSFVLPRAIAKLPEAEGQASGSRSFQASILAWVFSESVAIHGVVLFVLGADATWLWAHCAASAVLLGLHAPREESFTMRTRSLARPDVKIG